MIKKELQQLFQNPYSHGDWLTVLKNIFGAKQLYSQPQPILLPSNQQATKAFELGSFTTSDDRIIGLYQINLNENVWLQRNKVGLRELLRNVYKYDVDGAIVVFVQEEKWRLSFISEIKVLNDEGEVVGQATEPKRYTYLLGEGEKVKTPSDRLSKLGGKTLALKDMLDAFSVEALNEEFYKVVQQYFYQLVGGKIGKGKKQTDYGSGTLNFPDNITVDHQTKQEFAVRLIGRMIFCWFLKMKTTDDAGTPLLPQSLLSSQAVKDNENYYHQILERLFFQTLNTPMKERLENLPEETKAIPFLNGGLFEPRRDDFYQLNKKTGGNAKASESYITDDWFLHFFEELEKYNFTIDENSVTEIEVSVDPEMLGRIFENLLAEIDPDTGESARKATGSFYTPREIVDYMATESLVQYIHNKTEIDNDKLRPIFKLLDAEDPNFSKAEKNGILGALDTIKILDPACGSGAFPMGVLQKIVQALQKLDPESKWWKKRQLAHVRNPVVKKQLREKLESSGVEYARKVGIIQNSLYGVDIQPVAAQISKLRCFLSLIVDETIDDSKENRGIEPLPNLEFKFVTADTLMKLPEEKEQRTLFDNYDELQDLETLRNEYIQSYGQKKQRLKAKFSKTQQKIAKDQSSLFADQESKAYKLGNWNPFGHEKSDWFDPKWMFGVEKFDVVIGNPPYIKEYTNKAAFDGIRGKKFYQGKMDIWYYFACYLFDFLSENGNLTFIATNNWVTNAGASKLREKINEDCKIIQLIDFGDTKVFSSAGIQTMVLIAENSDESDPYKFDYRKITNASAMLSDAVNMLKNVRNEKYLIAEPLFDRELLKGKSLVFNAPETDKLLGKIKAKQNFNLDAKKEVAQGIVAPQDSLNSKGEKLLNYTIEKGSGIFVLSDDERSQIKLNNEELELLKPYYTTENLGKFYGDNHNKLWLIYTTANFKNPFEMDIYPNIKKHLDKFKSVITSDNKPYGLHRARNDYFFKGEKIISLRKNSTPVFTFTEFDCYVSQTFYVIKTKRINQKYLTALLNSKLVEFWLRYKGKMQGFNFQIDKKPLLEIPIYKPVKTKFFETIVDYLLFILPDKTQINTHVSNAHIAQVFEEVIDAMVMELYFKEDFEKAGIAFIKYAERDFESIEDKNEEEQIQIIQKAYQKLREKDNKIHNNLKLMDSKLADIVEPIKAGK